MWGIKTIKEQNGKQAAGGIRDPIVHVARAVWHEELVPFIGCPVCGGERESEDGGIGKANGSSASHGMQTEPAKEGVQDAVDNLVRIPRDEIWKNPGPE